MLTGSDLAISNNSFLRLVTTHFNCRLIDGFNPAGHLKSQIFPVQATVTPSLMFNALLFFGSPRKIFSFEDHLKIIWCIIGFNWIGWCQRTKIPTAIVRNFLFSWSGCWCCCCCSDSCCWNCCMKLSSIESFRINILANPINVWRCSCVDTIKTLGILLFLFWSNDKETYRASTTNTPWNNTTKNWLVTFDTNHRSTRVALTCVNSSFSISCAQHSVFVNIISRVSSVTNGIVDNWYLKI